jgi:DNA (cytosine-5)-methyltransferase 1
MHDDTIRSVDLFAGGGGASEGIRLATGAAPLVAINHDEASIKMHATNHPGTMHLCESVFDVDPFLPHGKMLDLLWASPDCTHFSRAKGGRPRSQEIRGLAWVVLEWAANVRPRVIALENVPEFKTWGPLDDEGRIIKERKGETFEKFNQTFRDLGYRIEWQELVAADYGAPTTRKRLFGIARCDGMPIRWPEPTHGPGRPHPYRVAAECIDWDIPCPSIFTRKRPLAEKTMARIAEGIKRYVIETDSPFLLNLTHGGRLEPLEEPFRTITAANRGEKALVVPYGIQTRNGERKGQRPRTLDLGKPMNTITSQGSQGALVQAFLAKHYTGVYGQPLKKTLGTITAKDHHALVAAHLEKFYGTAKGADIEQPMPTVTASSGGGHMALVASLLVKYYGSGGQWQSLKEPMHTIVSKARFGLVTVNIGGEEYAITDIGMRMLQPRELARAQGFDDSYQLIGTKTSQIARIGNSVPPPVVRAIVAAQFPGRQLEEQGVMVA